MKLNTYRNVLKVFFITLGLATVMSYQACAPAPQAEEEAGSGNPLNNGFNYSTGSVNEKAAIAILRSRCASCHNETYPGSLKNVTDVNSLVANEWIYPGDALNSKLSRVLDTGGISGVGVMPPGGMSANEKFSVRTWINEIQRSTTDTTFPRLNDPFMPVPTTQYTGPVVKYSTQVKPALMRSCYNCHSIVSSGLNVANNQYWVVKGTLSYSGVYTTSRPNGTGQPRGGMPNNPAYPDLTIEEWNNVGNWILQGAPDN